MFHWPSWVSPHWDAKREKELLEFYGGKDSAGWQHEVAGEHGKAAYGAFNAEQFLRAITIVPEYQRIVTLGKDLAACATEEELRDRIETVLNLAPDPGVYLHNLHNLPGTTQDRPQHGVLPGIFPRRPKRETRG